MKVSVLGTEYQVKLEVSEDDDKYLKELAGYTDETSKVIVVSKCNESTFDDPQAYKNKTLLHEIIHSFLNESGLPKETCDWHCEEMVEWCATMIPKIMETYESVVKVGNTIESQWVDGEKKTIQLDGNDIHEKYKRGSM